MSGKHFQKWAFGFSAKALKTITVMWAASMAYGAFLITAALFLTGSILEPVNFISEINRTFAGSVVAILITRTVGNIFEHNDGGIFGKSIGGMENDGTDCDFFTDGMRDADGTDN